MDYLYSLFDKQNSRVICGLTDELNVFYILNLFKKSNKNIIVLTSSLYEANNYYNLLQTYTSDTLLFLMDDFISSMVKTSSPELKLTRLNTLDLISSKKHIIVTNLMGFLKFLPNDKENASRVLKIEKNSILKRDVIVEKIVELGYKKESITTSTGEFSVRGMIIDVFLINEKHPIRIEFDDDRIDNIRYYDEETQRTINQIDLITLKPVSENEMINNPSSLVDYAKNPLVVKIDQRQINASYYKLQEDILDYTSKNKITERLMFTFEDIDINESVELNHFAEKTTDLVYECSSIDNFNEDYDLLKRNVDKWLENKKEVVFYLSNKNEIKKISKILPNIKIVNKKINKGFIIDKYVAISEFDIENTKHNYKYQNNLYGGKKISNYNDLKVGDYIVHIAHGIGIYNGIATLTKDGIKKDYIQLLYLNNDKIYIPVEKINNIYKYSDKDGNKPHLNRLNSSSWLKTRAYVQKKVQDISRELIELYKQRVAITSDIYRSFPEEDVFASEFNFDLTSDQQKSINDIYADLQSSHPMDRLLCGDVGFGKTEVAFRAMFKTVLNNSQVMYLCPTTILSKQQYSVAKERFKNWPIEIALLNRFTSKKEEGRIIEDLKTGKIDMVFGTHKLLNDKISFKNLGLMIVDEEQRFGVKHKEKIKEMKHDVNVLTLSATPIPRTLKLALSGLRDLSIIDTPPLNRYPVQTYVVSEDDLIIKDAIYKELARHGQIFILFNNIENIETRVEHLRKLIPSEEIRYAHGQMDKEDLDTIMEDFVNQKFNIIVCTTIIENGIDIPNANTLIVYDADRLGLAQLYQLRGRVGRSNKVAYAYLMYDKGKMLNDIAVKRLQAIRDFTELGSGYKIAMRDLSIRGAGDLLGSEQAGFVESVGISLYTKMVEEEMKRLKGEEVYEEDSSESLIHVTTHIDDKYVSDEEIKIEIHKLINEIDSYDKLYAVKEELIDRFGNVSDELEIYMYEELFEKLANKLNIKDVVQNNNSITVYLPIEESSLIKGDKLFMEAFSINPKFQLKYIGRRIQISLNFNNTKRHFIYDLVKLFSLIVSDIKE